MNDTWLGAWNAMPPQRPVRLPPFLGRIARNTALDRYDYNTAQCRGVLPAVLEELEECVSGAPLEEALDLYNDPQFLVIRDKGLENLSAADILEDEKNYSERVFFLKSNKFVSEYQGRLYENYGDNGIYDGKKVYLDGMREYFSEGVRVFYTDPRLLEKKDPDLYEYIKELMK